ncbi:uncharacterized protein isoform X2 [Choristoneura fumiferana]|uniref:uncharacterized protein isoform X2 n=1 Tax=Choristoneura fumiferana TaxID=7141 RepID=UPI003D15EAAD
MLSSKKSYLVSLVFILYLTSAIAYYQWVLYQVKTSQEKTLVLNSIAKIKSRQTEEVYNATNLGHRNLTLLEFLKLSASSDPNSQFVGYLEK